MKTKLTLIALLAVAIMTPLTAVADESTVCEIFGGFDCEDETESSTSDYTVIGTNNYFEVTGLPNSYTSGEPFTINIAYGTFESDATLHVYAMGGKSLLGGSIFSESIPFGMNSKDVTITPAGNNIQITILVGTTPNVAADGSWNISKE